MSEQEIVYIVFICLGGFIALGGIAILLFDLIIWHIDKEIINKRHRFFIESSTGIILSGTSVILFFLSNLAGKNILCWLGMVPFSVAIVLAVFACKEKKRIRNS